MFINIGFKNYINRNEVLAVVSPNTSPGKRMIDDAKKKVCL